MSDEIDAAIAATPNLQPKSACGVCGKLFDSAAGLRMHNIRKHSNRGWSTGHNFYRGGGTSGTKAKGVSETPVQRQRRLEMKRRYQLRLRERYYREGKDSRGKPRPEGWKPKRRRGIRQSPEAMRQYKREWFAKNRAKKNTPLIVYPEPGQSTQTTLAQQPEPKQRLEYCPRCGEHLSSWKKT